MSELNANFEKAALDVQGLATRPSDDTMLSIYALYKQGSQGDVSGKRPGMLSPVKRAKYDAWAKHKGKSRDEAKQAYIDLVNSLL